MSDVVTPDDEEVSRGEIYRVAVEEYRFQAQFNWNRVQYLLAFNAGILAVGVALSPSAGPFAVSVFGLGVVAAVMTILVHRVQHSYYRKARDRMKRVEEQFGIKQDARTDTTSTLSGAPRKISVTEVVYVLLGAIALADLINIGIVIVR